MGNILKAGCPKVDVENVKFQSSCCVQQQNKSSAKMIHIDNDLVGDFEQFILEKYGESQGKEVLKLLTDSF